MYCLWLLLGYNRKVVVARHYITCKTKNIYTLWLFKEKPAGSGTEVAADQWTNLGTTEKHRGVRNGGRPAHQTDDTGRVELHHPSNFTTHLKQLRTKCKKTTVLQTLDIR